MEIDDDGEPRSPCPELRLCLTLVLGVAGTLLLPVGIDYTPIPLQNADGLRFFSWVLLALLAVRALHVVEISKTSAGIYTLAGVGLMLSLFFPAGAGVAGEKGVPMRLFTTFGAALVFAIAGAWQSRLAAVSRQSWIRSIQQAVSICIAAPLLLFAQRPVDKPSRPAFPLRLFRFAFALFPFVLAAGYSLSMLGWKLRTPPRWARELLFSFANWSWIGCGLIQLLSSWPDLLHLPAPDDESQGRIVGKLGTILLAALVAIFTVTFGLRYGFDHLLRDFFFGFDVLIWPLAGLMFIFLIGPWPTHPKMFKIDPLPHERTLRPWATLLFWSIALVSLASFARFPVLHVLSGELFGSGFSRSDVGGALDQPSLTKSYFLCTLLVAVLLPYAAAARWLGRGRGRLGWIAYAAPLTLSCAVLAIMLVIPLWQTIKYVAAMGLTFARVGGLLYLSCLFGLLFVFYTWAVAAPHFTPQADGQQPGDFA